MGLDLLDFWFWVFVLPSIFISFLTIYVCMMCHKIIFVWSLVHSKLRTEVFDQFLSAWLRSLFFSKQTDHKKATYSILFESSYVPIGIKYHTPPVRTILKRIVDVSSRNFLVYIPYCHSYWIRTIIFHIL